jgi:hypothetical protein
MIDILLNSMGILTGLGIFEIDSASK